MRGAGGMKIRYTVFIQSIQMYISKKGILAAQLLGKTIFQGITRGISYILQSRSAEERYEI